MNKVPRMCFLALSSVLGSYEAILTTIFFLGSLQGHRSRDHSNTISHLYVLAKSAQIDFFVVRIMFNDIFYFEYIRLHNMRLTVEIIYVAILY